MDFFRNKTIYRFKFAITEAIIENDVDKLRTLLDNQPSSDIAPYFDQEHITMAVYLQRREILTMFLNHRPQLSSANRKSYGNMMHYGVMWGDVDVISLIIRKYPQLRETNENLKTPMDLAFDFNRLDIVCLFLCKSHMYKAPKFLDGVQQACTKLRTLDIAQFLNSGESINETVPMESNILAGWSLLHIAVMAELADTVILLLKNGANISAKNKEGLTPMHLADQLKNSLLVQIMISSLAKKNVFENTHDEQDGISFFHLACKNGVRIPQLTRCFFNNDIQQVDVSEACNPTGEYPSYTALHFAVRSEEKFIVKFLISKKADIFKKDSTKKTALHLAYERNSTKLVKLLLESMEKYDNITDLFGFSHYHIACATSPNVINKFIKAKKNHNNAIDIQAFKWAGFTPLHFAVQSRNCVNVMMILSKTQLNIDARTASHKTALHLSIENSFTKISIILITHGANINIVDKEHNSPLHLANDKSQVKIIKCMLKNLKDFSKNPVNRKGTSHFHIACKYGASEVVESYINKCYVNVNLPSGYEIIQPNSTNSPINGQSPLHLAVACGDIRTSKVLLHYGAIANVWNAEGETPLLMALHHLNSPGCDLIELLLTYGADPNMASSQNGHTVLHRIALLNWEYTKIFEFLLAKKADPNRICNQGNTPLHLACVTGKLELVRLLLDFDADVHAKNVDGWMPIHILVDYNCPENEFINNRDSDESDDNSWDNSSRFRKLFAIIEALLEAGFKSIDVKNNIDSTAAILACERWNPEFLEALLLHETNTNLIEYVMPLFLTKTREEFAIMGYNIALRRYTATNSSEDRNILNSSELHLPDFHKVLNTQECCDEIQKIKMVRFNARVVLFDVLSGDLDHLALLSGNTELMNYLKSEKTVKQFPLYGDIMRVNLKKGLRRRKYFERVKKGTEKMVGGLLPDPVFEKIKSFIGSDEQNFKNLLTAMNC